MDNLLDDANFIAATVLGVIIISALAAKLSGESPVKGALLGIVALLTGGGLAVLGVTNVFINFIGVLVVLGITGRLMNIHYRVLASVVIGLVLLHAIFGLFGELMG